MVDAGRWDCGDTDGCFQMLLTQSATRTIAHSGLNGGNSHDGDLRGIILVTIDEQAVAGRNSRADVKPRKR